MRCSAFIFLLFLSYILPAQVSFNIDSVGWWRDATFPMNGLNNTYNEVWGFEMKGREYAVIGSRKGTSIIDITNPRKPVLSDFIAGAHDDATNRDYHDYRGYLYMVCDQGNSTLQIADLRYLPDSVHLVYDSDELFTNSHTIFIDTNTSRMYACRVSREDTSGMKVFDMEIFDLSASYIPTRLLTYDVEEVNEFHDIFVKNDTAIGNNGHSGLFFYDFTDVANVKVLASIIDYPEKGYNHSGHSTPDGRYYYFTDETHGTDVKVVDVRGYADPQVSALFNAGTNQNEIIAHNLLVRDSFLFISYYPEGLQVFSISNPSSPVKIGHYQTYTKPVDGQPGKKDYSGYSGAWGVYPYLPSGYILVSDREKGLFIFDVSELDGNHHPGLLPSRLLYPNPANTYVDLTYPFKEVVKVQIFNDNGRLVEKSARITNVKTFTRIHFQKVHGRGLYFLKVEGRTEAFTLKLIIE